MVLLVLPKCFQDECIAHGPADQWHVCLHDGACVRACVLVIVIVQRPEWCSSSISPIVLYSSAIRESRLDQESSECGLQPSTVPAK